MSAIPRRPRLGFLGTGWIGRHRLQAIAASGLAEISAIADPVAANAEAALTWAPAATVVAGLPELLGMELDGIVIATPSALHAEQAITALGLGYAVFCQKPLGRSAEETARVVEAARSADRLLEVDLSYRHLTGARLVRQLVQDGALGDVYAADLVFHNAYGPDKPWFYDPALSGGGCVIDLGIHLVDLALWTLAFPAVSGVSARLFAGGVPLAGSAHPIEDYAVATLDLGNGAVVRLACSWNLSAGCDAVIGAEFHGTMGSASLHNVGGSFYDFTATRARGTTRETLAGPPEDWGGRAAVAWVRALADGQGYDDRAEHLVSLASAIDDIYGRTSLVGAA
ncbi:MAG TPA: Gfo/Idh/MocA family oxidoreductase [Gemmatimonadales bacterium]|nr:Gfo/Idh/MocA family oxidoreductase [Gemmatimonadales bacterium]